MNIDANALIQGISNTSSFGDLSYKIQEKSPSVRKRRKEEK